MRFIHLESLVVLLALVSWGWDLPAARGQGSRRDPEAIALYRQAKTYVQQSRFEEAIALYRRALPLLQGTYPNWPGTPENIAEVMIELAKAYRYQGDIARAEAAYRDTLTFIEARLGPTHYRLGLALNSFAMLYDYLGQLERAEPLYYRSLKIFTALNNSKLQAVVLNNLGAHHEAGNDYARAETCYLQSLKIRLAAKPRDERSIADTVLNLGVLATRQGQYDKAEPLVRRFLQVLEAAGETGEAQWRGLWALAGILSHKGRYDEAEELYRRAAKINASMGPDHHTVSLPLAEVALLRGCQGRWDEAVDLMDRVLHSRRREDARFLPGLSEAEVSTYLLRDYKMLFRGLSLALARPGDRRTVELSADWAVNGTGVAHQVFAERALWAADSKNPALAGTAQRLRTVRQEMARLALVVAAPEQAAAQRRQLEQLQEQEAALSRQLGAAGSRRRGVDPWTSLADVRRALAADAVLVEIVRLGVHDFRAPRKPEDEPHYSAYVAWVIPAAGRGEVRLIDLGKAEAIDRLVAQARKALIESARTITKVGEVEASDALQKPLQELSAKVLQPLLPAIDRYQEWIVCPDGALWLVPWSALLLPDDKFAVEKHTIRHVVTGRDLVLELPRAKAAQAVILADPDYDLSPGKVLAAAGGLRGLSGPGLLGQRLAGMVGTARVFFEFGEGKVVITGELTGEGSWKQQGNTLTIQTQRALFQGTLEETAIRGQRSIRNDDGSVTRDTFRIDLPRIDPEGTRSVGSLPKVPRLPGTAAEAAAVRARLRRWLGQEPRVFLDAEASEATLKAVKSPRVLTLATHGYFLPSQDVEQKDRPGLGPEEGKHSVPLVDKKGQAIENPLLRCGLLLAGCNRGTEAKAGEDDGILTGVEILGLDLRGCELVVLSACETGLGEVRNGEGVAGLRQAFQLAGAKGVLASLWQVPDRETALLMNAFYGEIAKGRSQAEALRQAQLERIATRREGFGAAHPFFWAAFTLTSRGPG